MTVIAIFRNNRNTQLATMEQYVNVNVNHEFIYRRVMKHLYCAVCTLESDRSHDEARLPDNYVTLKPITDADNRCLIFVNPDAQRPLVLSPLGPRRLRRSKGVADGRISFRGGRGDVGGAF